jgi:hypothetical protein
VPRLAFSLWIADCNFYFGFLFIADLRERGLRFLIADCGLLIVHWGFSVRNPQFRNVLEGTKDSDELFRPVQPNLMDILLNHDSPLLSGKCRYTISALLLPKGDSSD